MKFLFILVSAVGELGKKVNMSIGKPKNAIDTSNALSLLLVASLLQMEWFFFGCVTLFKVLPHKLVCVRVCLSLSYCLFLLVDRDT